ncbi:MAG: YARHG domain-containing protein [Lachnospiraceae bacterium]|nr:YARHG domain-containing protein [Lachnospiraceae bacterium]
MLYCKYCGTPLEEDDRFCVGCGRPVAAPGKKHMKPGQEPVKQGSLDPAPLPGGEGRKAGNGGLYYGEENESFGSSGGKDSGPDKRRIAVIAAALAAAVFVCAFFVLLSGRLLNGDGKAENENNVAYQGSGPSGEKMQYKPGENTAAGQISPDAPASDAAKPAGQSEEDRETVDSEPSATEQEGGSDSEESSENAALNEEKEDDEAEIKKAEEEKRAEEERKAEEAKKAEEERKAQEAKKAEEERKAEEAKKAEEERKAEEARKAEEERKAEEAKKAEEERKAEEAKKAEEKRRAEEAKKAEEEEDSGDEEDEEDTGDEEDEDDFWLDEDEDSEDEDNEEDEDEEDEDEEDDEDFFEEDEDLSGVNSLKKLKKRSGIGTESMDSGYILPDSDKRTYTREELSSLDDYSIQMAINELYARRGRKFSTPEIQEYFNGKSWYKGTISPEKFDETEDSVFNEYEIKNRELLADIRDERMTESDTSDSE